MSRTIEFVTPEQVAIHYELAGIGSRGVAAAVDFVLQLLVYGVLVSVPIILVQVQVLPAWPEMQESVVSALLIFIFYLVLWGYYIFFETLWNGETPGKRWMCLRVIKDGGYPVDFRSVVIRNLVRAADTLPVLYGVGFICTLLHKRYQRLGDLAGGTLVIRYGREDRTLRVALGKAQVFRLLDASVLSQLSRLSREEYRLVQRFLERRDDLPFALRGEFAQRLARRLIEKFGYQEPALGMDYLRWLEELDMAFRRRTLGIVESVPIPAAASAAPPATEPAPPVAMEAPPSTTETRRW